MERQVLLAEIGLTAVELNIDYSRNRAETIVEFINQHSENPLETLALAGDNIDPCDLRIVAAVSNEKTLKHIGGGPWRVCVATKTCSPIDKCPVVFTGKQIKSWWLDEREGITISSSRIREAYIRDLVATNVELYNQPRNLIGSLAWWLSPLSTRLESAKREMGDSLFFRLPKPFTDFFYDNKTSPIAYYGAIVDSLASIR